MEVRVDGRKGHPHRLMIPMASTPRQFVPTMERNSVQQTESKSVLPMVRYGSEGRQKKRTASPLDHFYGFHTMGVCTYHGEVQHTTNGIKIGASYGEIWK